ncbi:MAG: AtuA-related protein [Advenella sp.]
MLILLQHLAHTRSGDKGNTSNISVFAYEPEFYELLKAQLTAERIKAFYGGVITGDVLRYEVDNIHAMNFVAHGALGGGVSRSLCLDNYGKALSAAILGFKVEVPESLCGKLHGQQLL